jgi:NAD(P)H-dependent flavin oxidoreductase YrpB (nitropropane dioxygenase family)
MGPIATPELAAAVTQSGALGMLGGEGLSIQALDANLSRIRELTPGPFGVNFILPFLEDPEAVRLAAARCRVVEFFYGTPDAELVRMVHSGKAVAAWQIGSAAEARAAADAGCDFVIAQGLEAGGHLRGQLGRKNLLKEVLHAVEVPVLAAGGIGSGRDAASAMADGASGVRVGTRFIAATESGAHRLYVRALIDAMASDTVITEVFSRNWKNAPHRVLRSCVAAALDYESDVIGETDGRPVHRFSGSEPLKQTTGTIGAMCLYAGESVEEIKGVQPASAIVEQLVAEMVDAVG